MRRSRTIRLTLLAASAMALQACGEDLDATDVVVSDLAACVERFGASAEAECRATMADAQARHAATAPRYGSIEACREGTGGECQMAPASLASEKAVAGGGVAGFAIPVMAGVLISRMMADGTGRMVSPLHAGRPPGQCPPGQNPAPANCAPRGASGVRHYYSGSSYAGSAPERRGAAAFTPSATMAAGIASARATGATSVRRGGFGASARGYSSSS